ncbi:uracil-DNA glycosylase, family 4 [Campylobacter blaseri]|uniref:Uracil-DNA glycosylase-like domain-containing protein n=1 Tax=Campylobacter blaseri TaxID=2042961 RepID=A0A2P8QZR4_9BACT|nr:uracil-DNA glycosylase [Campylobacter blaseri]PSM51735.1 hypothetical protein CQ405_06295 [Campylobacter blaseri]PSM53526.1 hypothetical protein CRN67_06300 [Campylobacter blaseri]QKF86336.1 uracil-DNA glycosylase, family 4 [Campylobacter blaseri]
MSDNIFLIQRLQYYKAFGYKYIDDNFINYKHDNNFENIEKLQNALKCCELCAFSKNRKNSIFSNNTSAKLMVILENPTFKEDESGKLYSGEVSIKLRELLLEYSGLKEDEIYTSFLIKCKTPKNVTITEESVMKCSPYLFEEIDKIKPKVILTMGELCSKIVLQDSDLPSLDISHGSVFKLNNSFLIPVFDMDYIAKNPSKKDELIKDLEKIRELI